MNLARTGQLRRAHQRREADSTWAAANPSVAVVVVPADAGSGLVAGVADAASSAFAGAVDIAGDVIVDVVVELPGVIIEGIFDSLFD